MTAALDCAFQPKQEQLYQLVKARGPNAATWIGFGGARGGAKSGAVRRCALALAWDEPGITVWIFRRLFPDLKKDHIDKFFEDWPDLRQYYKITDHEIILPNRSKIVFVYAETLDEVMQKFRGPEAKYIFIDQAEQLPEEALQRLHAANRQPGAAPGDCKTICTFNPGGIGTEFLRRVFFLKQYKGEERPSDFAFIQSYGWDNHEWFRGIIPDPDAFYAMASEERFQLFITHTDYGRKLNELPPQLRLGELLGSFEHFAGQYFAGVWDEQVCTITAAQADQIIQPWWTAWMAQDWGFGDHDCNLWFASGKVSPSDWMQHFGGFTEWPVDVVIIYREYVINERAEKDLAMDIVDCTPAGERHAIQRFFFSQDGLGQRAKQHGAHSVGEQFSDTMRQYGLPTPEPADQDRVDGWRFMYSCLRQSHLRGQEITQERTKEGPALFVSAECPNVISCIPLAVRDEDNREDVMRVPGVLWEDVTDACRYGLKSMLDPKSKAPRAIRRQMVYDSVEDMNSRAMALRHFDAAENKRTLVSRGRRWR